MKLSDGYIYAVVAYFSLNNLNSGRQIWKVDASNGQILWKKQFYYYQGNYSMDQDLIDYDTNRLLAGYFQSEGHAKYAFIDKMTGDT